MEDVEFLSLESAISPIRTSTVAVFGLVLPVPHRNRKVRLADNQQLRTRKLNPSIAGFLIYISAVLQIIRCSICFLEPHLPW